MTFTSIKNTRVFARLFCCLPAAMLLANTLRAQEPDTAMLRKMMVKYADQNSVVLNFNQKLTLKFEGGELLASSETSTERLLISESAPSQDNKDFVYDGYSSELTDFHAVAYVPRKNGSFEKRDHFETYVTGAGDGISDSKFYVTSFAGLTSGSFIRVKSQQDHPELTFLPFYSPIETEYPVAHSTYEVVVPNFVNIKFAIKGVNTEWIKQTTEEKNGNIIYKFTGDNLPGYKQFSNVPGPLYTRPFIVTYLASYRLPGSKKDSFVLNDAAHLHKKEYRFIRGMNIKEDTGLNKLVAQITKGDVTQRQKAEHLYNWVQKNIRYIGFEIGLGGWVPREADTVLKKKYGDCKDMASLLMKMGHVAGLETYFASIGTTRIPYTFEELPIPFICNHMICALKLDGQWIFMDGTHYNLPFGANRDDIQGKEAFIAMDENRYEIVTIPTLSGDKNVTVDSTFLRISERNDENVVGNFVIRYAGYPAWDLGLGLKRYTKDREEREKIVHKLTERGTNKYSLDKYQFNISDTGSKNITLTGDFNVGGYVNKAGKNYIINLNMVRHLANQHIDTTDRRASWYNDYKYHRREVLVFEIPKDMKVTYLPKNATGKLNDLWDYAIAYKTDGKRIILTKEYRMNTLSIDRGNFDGHNKAINVLARHYKESVVLTAK